MRNDITSLNEAITTDDADKIREALDRLKNSSMEIGKAIYSQSSESDSQGEQQAETESQEQDNQEQQQEENKEEKK